MATEAGLYMPKNGDAPTTLNTCLKNLTDMVTHVGVIDSNLNKITVPIKEDVNGNIIDAFPNPSGGSTESGVKTPILIDGSTTQVIIEKVFISHGHHTDADFEIYDETNITSDLTLAKRTYDEIGTFVIDNIMFELSINQNY